MKSSPALAALLFLLVLPFGLARAEPPRTIDARQLLISAERAVAGTRTAAGADERLRSRTAFWTALDKVDAALRQVRAGLASRDGRFFRGLEQGSAALGELRVVWSRAGSMGPQSEPRVAEGIRILSSSFRLLRGGYGREAVRSRQGGGLTELEKQRFQRIQQAQRRFADSLRPLLDRSRERGDAAMLAELRRMAEEAERIAAAAATLEAYLNALILGDIQRGEWEGNSYYAPATDRSEWLEAGTVVEELYVEQDVGHVFTLDLGSEATGARLDEPVEVGEVEVYEPLASTSVEEVSAVDLDGESDEPDEAEEDEAEDEESLVEEEMEETGIEGSELELYEEAQELALDEETGGTAGPAKTEPGKPAEPAGNSAAKKTDTGEIEEEDLPVEPVPSGPDSGPEVKREIEPEGEESSDPPQRPLRSVKIPRSARISRR